MGKQLMMDVLDLVAAVREDKVWLLFVCNVIDMIGLMSYFPLLIGELADFIWAPCAAFFLHFMFGSMVFSSLGFFEEILFFTDICPTATLAWMVANMESLKPLKNLIGAQSGAENLCMTMKKG